MWKVQGVLEVLLLMSAEAFYFESGYTHHYTYKAENSLFGHENVTTILKFQVSPVNKTENGHKLHSLTVESLVQLVRGGVADNPKHWDLSKTFLFVINEKGSVTLVHCHPEDHDELVFIKKAMVSVFSVNVQTQDEDVWQYSVQETDHLGLLDHNYTAQRTSSGFSLERTHYSIQYAHRFHRKTLLYDDKGVLHSAQAIDRVLLKDRIQEPMKRSSLPGETPHIIQTSGDFPEIESSVTVNITFHGKRFFRPPAIVFTNLTMQTLETKQKELIYTMEAVRTNISTQIKCIQQYPDKDDLNRTICINNLRSLLTKLTRNDYEDFVNGTLSKDCPRNDSACVDRRLIVIDIVARIGDKSSQSLLLRHVLSRQSQRGEELRRVFIHCAALNEPTVEFVSAVESICFGKDGSRHGTRTMSHSQSRACLAVGSLIRHLDRAGQDRHANRLARRLESWLEEHGKADSHVSKRDTWLTDTDSEEHHMSKAILLHALGNAALPRSRRHLVLHALPNRGHHLWRRASLDALRHYTCNESASAVLDSLLHDNVYSVSRMALSVYANHPRRREVIREQEDILLSKNYTYPALTRVKRDLLDRILLKFKLAIPSLEWSKSIGTRDIGASFGIYFENSIDVLFQTMSGYVDINVHDKIWSEAHIGLIGLRFDLLTVETCFRGRLEYNMNIMKDFSLGLYEDISSAFDHIALKILQPMETFVNDVATRYHDPITNQSISGFQPLSQVLKQLPLQTESALQTTIKFSQIADTLSGLPLVSKLQQLAGQAQSLMEDVHSEATDFSANIADIARVVLPFSEKEIRSSINTVLKNLEKASKAPHQVFLTIESAKFGYHLGLRRILEGNKIIQQAASFLSGSRSTFMNAGAELKNIATSTKFLVGKLKSRFLTRGKRDVSSFDEFGQMNTSGVEDTMDALFASADVMVEQFYTVANNSTLELQTALDKLALYIEILKKGLESFKEATDMIKSRIAAFFGLKFHPKFPEQRRACDGTCGCGFFPTDCTRYGHPGIDLKWERSWGVPSPVAGMMYASGNNSVVIRPETSGFQEYEIYLSNFQPIQPVDGDGIFVDAGQIIGSPLGSGGCEDSHFHLAMKRLAPDSSTNLCYYVDPSPFLDRMQPIPTWNQECRDFTLKHIGQIVDFRKLTKGFRDAMTELLRLGVDVWKQILVGILERIPDNEFLEPMKDIAIDLIGNVDLDPANRRNYRKQDAPSKFQRNTSSKNYNIRSITQMSEKVASKSSGTKKLSPSLTTVNDRITKSKNVIRNPPARSLRTAPTGTTGRLLSSRGVFATLSSSFKSLSLSKFILRGKRNADSSGDVSITDSVVKGSGSTLNETETGLDMATDVLPSFGQGCPTDDDPESEVDITSFAGGRLGMLTSLKTSACKTCPTFGTAFHAVSGTTCLSHQDCLGINCDVIIQGGGRAAHVDIVLKVYPEETKMTVTVGGQTHDIEQNSTRTVIRGLSIFDVLAVNLVVSAVWQETELHVSLTADACSLDACLPTIQVITDVRFDVSKRKKRSTGVVLDPFVDNMESVPIDDLTKMFSDFNIPLAEVLEQLNGIQDTISSELKTSDVPTDQNMEEEFKNPVDYVDTGSYPQSASENSEIYIPFYVFALAYPLGPILFKIEFSAGGALGLTYEFSIRAIDSQLMSSIKPWISARLDATFSIDIIVAQAGIQLDGYLLKTMFPLSLTNNFTKHPVIYTKSLDVDLIPVELILRLFVELFFGLFKMDFTLWHWRADPIRRNIWNKEFRIDDKSAPRFPYCDAVLDQCKIRFKRETTQLEPVCSVVQVVDRHPEDPAFKLEFSVEDEESSLRLWYAIGDYPGGTNVLDWTEIHGVALLNPAVLPCGIPLYFLVRVRNSQGLETIGRCSLSTYDCTIPDGRVDAAYRCSSHPSALEGSIIIFDDSQLKHENLSHAVGYSPGSFGHEVVDWLPLSVTFGQTQTSAPGDLRNFGQPRPGRLSSTPLKSLKSSSVSGCASECLKQFSCVSFSYNQYVQLCELQDVSESSAVPRKSDSSYWTYDRLGRAYTASVRYENLPLRHGAVYFMNAAVENVLGYQSVLSSEGTMVDFTPPEPGPVGDVTLDVMIAGGCTASILQRCVDAVPGLLNHRKVIDGKGSRTVFNGNRRGQDILFTSENYHLAANWDGFKDEECGIIGYTWAIGTTVCGTDVINFTDPHSSIPNPTDWTYTGVVKNLHLSDGEYFATVQAVSDVQHGGDLVTTVCHSTPIVVDTTPPALHSVEEAIFDETFRILVVYYNASDRAGIARMEMGLGKTKYDVMVRQYLPFEIRGQNGNTFLMNDEFEMTTQDPAWIRLKVVNNVGLSATGYSSSPILIDSTAPIAGRVMDGSKLGQDICYQVATTQICAQWAEFHDSESNIQSYKWGVGMTRGKDDALPFFEVSSSTRQYCAHLQLRHNATYFSTIIAYNRALNQKSVNASSDGVLVDTTPPTAGNIVDGDDPSEDVNYSSETASIAASWENFDDPESGLESYTLSVWVNNDQQRMFFSIQTNEFVDHSFSFKHGDFIHVELQATNKAGGKVTVPSNGFIVDHTPPELLHLSTTNKTMYQQTDSDLDFVWEFSDQESGIYEYKCVIMEFYQGKKGKLWPELADYYIIRLNITSPLSDELHLKGLSLQNGASYSLKVTAINRAKMSTSEESDGVTIDITAPVIAKITLSRPGEDEEVNQDSQVVHVAGEPLAVSWSPQDAESGIKECRVCVVLAGSPDCSSSLSGTRLLDGSSMLTTSFDNLKLEVSTDSAKILYQAYVEAFNNAGLSSGIVASKLLVVLRANVAGVVTDGQTQFDVDFSNDKTSVSVMFSGFNSEACGIDGYEWGVGTTPFATDTLQYSEYGLVIDNTGFGYARAHITLREGQTYYSSVRARTGYNCQEEYIVASSDGFTVDTISPSIGFLTDTGQVTSDEVVFVSEPENSQLRWTISDSSGVSEALLSLNVFDLSPRVTHVPTVISSPVSLISNMSSGESLFAAVTARDNAGNKRISVLPVVTLDLTPPSVVDLNCTAVVSVSAPLVTCSWLTVQEVESPLKSIQFGIGSGPSSADLVNWTFVPTYAQHWTCDTKDIISSSDVTALYITMLVVNAADLKKEVILKVINDVTPPIVASVSIVTSSKPGHHSVEQQCQTSEDFIEVFVSGLVDEECAISRVEIALGSSKGRSDVKPFYQYPSVNGMYILGNLALGRNSAIYAAVRVTNSVGLSNTAFSSAVVISLEPRLEVWDGPGDIDYDGQSELNLMQGSWSYSDPCPIISAEWSVQELGGSTVMNFTSIPATESHFYNDLLNLENFKTYVNFVRVKDALNRTFVAFSDGVTVIIQQTDTAQVRDGLELNDLNFQEAADTLSANWDDFGNSRSTLPSDQIIRYEAAVGTDRRFATTRCNVYMFEDVGLDTNITFSGLNLTAKTAIYYITVRAHSAAGSYVESSSDGIKVGYSGAVMPGRVQVNAYQNSLTTIRFLWTDFVSDMVIILYYAGIGTSLPPWNNGTYRCAELLQSLDFGFDIYALQRMNSMSMAAIEGLTLTHNTTYYVTVVAEDQMGHCSASFSHGILVDNTPPVAGNITVQGHSSEAILFIHSSDAIFVNLDDSSDPESGIQNAAVELLSSVECDASVESSLSSIQSITVVNETNLALRNLQLMPNMFYFLKVTITNRASLNTVSVSKAMMLDMTPPLAGVVKLGTDWTAKEKIILNQTSTIAGMIALTSTSPQSNCFTQTDLLSPELKSQWVALGGNFSKNCVGFDSSDLLVVVQHNAFLNGVDRGAVQTSKLPWVEGEHVFRITSASGESILSGLALASASLQPPFLTQNIYQTQSYSALQCNSSLELCSESPDGSRAQSSMFPDSGFGTGLTFLEENGQAKLLLWVQDSLQLRQVWVDLDFDPSKYLATYTLRLNKRVESGSELWDITLKINEQEKLGFSGYKFSGEFVLSLYTWNVNNSIPAINDVFKPFKAVLKVEHISMPPAVLPDCSYGKPFYDATSGIKEIWVGVSDSSSATANISPHKLLKSFCLPCIIGCKSICATCQGEHVSSGFQVYDVTLKGLSLKSASEVLKPTSYVNTSGSLPINGTSIKDELNEFILPIYYLDVRVINHAGLVTDIKSVSMFVDTSPPVINSVHCIDPEYSNDETVAYLGNNFTVKAVWDVSEDVSDIQGIWVSLGTRPWLDDVAPKASLGNSARDYVFRNLDGLLTENGVYFFSIEVHNEAGLVSQAWSNFTVRTIPPDMSSLTLISTNVTIETFSGVSVAIVNNTKHLEINLQVDPSAATGMDVEYYEWAIGTSEGKQDVFPRTRIGFKNLTKAAIEDGFMRLDALPVSANNVSIGDYTKKNYSSSSSPDPSANRFLMEPGRCLKQQIFGVSKAHVSSTVDAIPTCIRRINDVLIQASNSTYILIQKGSVFVSVDAPLQSEDLCVQLKISKGAFMAGLLDDANLDAQYGSSASAEFSPLIVRPDPIADETSRWLRKRAMNTTGPHLFLSPIADPVLSEDVTITYGIPKSVYVPVGSHVTLLIWNADLKKWISPEEVCPGSTQSYNNATRVVLVKLCPAIFSTWTATGTVPQRKKRSTTYNTQSLLIPRMLTVSVVQSSPANLPPVVHNMSLVLIEDQGTFEFELSYADDENDEMEFRIDALPQHGSAVITPDGRLRYTPSPNYNGFDVVYVTGIEVLDPSALTLGLVPNQVRFAVTVEVTSVNDPPALFYLPSRNSTTVTQELRVGPLAGNGINMSVWIQSNKTARAEIGIVVFGDADPVDLLKLLNQTQGSDGAIFEANDITSNDPRLSGINLTDIYGYGGKEIALLLNQSYSGHVRYDARLQDKFGAYSMQLTLDIYVLLNPCVHGYCEPKLSSHLCKESTRAYSFDPYLCRCELGYEGQWCQTETDECQTAICNPITDCVDLIGGYRCEVNVTKMAAIIVCVVVIAILSIALLVYKLKTRSSKVESCGYLSSTITSSSLALRDAGPMETPSGTNYPIEASSGARSSEIYDDFVHNSCYPALPQPLPVQPSHLRTRESEDISARPLMTKMREPRHIGNGQSLQTEPIQMSNVIHVTSASQRIKPGANFPVARQNESPSGTNAFINLGYDDSHGRSTRDPSGTTTTSLANSGQENLSKVVY